MNEKSKDYLFQLRSSDVVHLSLNTIYPDKDSIVWVITRVDIDPDLSIQKAGTGTALNPIPLASPLTPRDVQLSSRH
jgi:hypothetical protein